MDQNIMIQETVIFGLLILLVAFVLWLLYRRRQTISSLQYHRLEVLNRMIDKFGSGEEFAAFLQSEQGKQLLRGTSVVRTPYYSTRRTAVLRYLQVGVILMVLGAAFMVRGDRDPDAEYWGVMCLMLSFGLYTVALITYIWNRFHRAPEGDQPEAQAF